MPFYTLFSNAQRRMMFVHARNDSHAFSIFNEQQNDPNANIEDGFVFDRAYDVVRQKWTESDAAAPVRRCLPVLTKVNERQLTEQHVRDVASKLQETHGLKFELDSERNVSIDVDDLATFWLGVFEPYPEDRPQQDRDRADKGKVYQAHDLRGLVAILQKQLDNGRGIWKVRRATDPAIKPEPCMTDPEGVSVKIGDQVICIGDYQAE